MKQVASLYLKFPLKSTFFSVCVFCFFCFWKDRLPFFKLNYFEYLEQTPPWEKMKGEFSVKAPD